MSARKTHKTVPSAGQPNPALKPNPSNLIVGDAPQAPPEAAATETKKPKRVPFGSYIDPELQKELRVACAVHGIEIRDALDQAFRLWIDQNKV